MTDVETILTSRVDICQQNPDLRFAVTRQLSGDKLQQNLLDLQ